MQNLTRRTALRGSLVALVGVVGGYLAANNSRAARASTVSTVQPWWVHTAVKAWTSPAAGWVTTMRLSASTTPPPTGTWSTLTSGRSAAAAGAPYALARLDPVEARAARLLFAAR